MQPPDCTQKSKSLMKCYFHKAICGSPERACAFLGIEPKRKATVASSLRREFACPFNAGIPQAEPQSSHLFTLRVSSLLLHLKSSKRSKPKGMSIDLPFGLCLEVKMTTSLQIGSYRFKYHARRNPAPNSGRMRTIFIIQIISRLIVKNALPTSATRIS